ncbi:ATP-binding protein [Paractinoplanes rhizophilus]|uniref:ATP-binding protein n=1 Tax=Paractinoplanes rhizophilus TaxID=1416877 RepID=A0ABW2HV78_9ACTN
MNRGNERAALKRLLTASRLVTVTGVAGVGKTRTVLRVAAEVQRAFPDGVWLADLAPLPQADLVAEAVALAVGLRDQSTRPQADTLAEYLANQHLLLVLDNCEHLAESCARLVDSLLRAAPALRVLVTSRQPLVVQGEHVFPLLPLPPAGAAVTLFTERARAASPTFALTDDNRDEVARLCRGLDGIPLAIELAAVRARALPVRQIAELLEGRMADRFALLSGGVVAGRHESLRTAIDWSHGLCTAAESLLWARVSVFAGDFDLAAVREVCDGDLEVLAALVDKSILLGDGGRYRLLDTIREYGLELLRATGEEELFRGRHRDFYLRLARQFDAEWCGPGQVDWYRRLSREHANLRAALDFHLTDATGLELAGSLLFFWIACGHAREGRHYLDRMLAVEHPVSPALARALFVSAWVATMQGDMPTVAERIEQCRPHADTAIAGWLGYLASICALFEGDTGRALAIAEEAARLHRSGGDPGTGLLVALAGQGIALAFAGQFDREIAVTEQVRTLSGRYRERWMRSYADYLRALAEMGRGDPVAAVSYGRDALRFKRQLGDSSGCAMAIDVLATAAAALGDALRAARLLGVAHRMWEAVGKPQLGAPDLVATRVAVEKQARATAGDDGFDAAYAEGLGLEPEAGIDYALGEPPRAGAAPSTSGAAGWAPLTRREREVAALVAEGLTNQQIADRLVIGRRTANTHVEHILTKLDFTSRAQIAAWAAHQGAA